MDFETMQLKEKKDLVKSKNNKTWNFDASQRMLVYQNADLLLNWYKNLSEASPELKKDILNLIKDHVLEEENVNNGIPRSTSQLFFYALIKLNLIDEALDILFKRNEYYRYSNLILHLIGDGIEEFSRYLDKKQIVKLQRSINGMRVCSNYKLLHSNVNNKLINLRFRFLEKSINKINIEINRDKAQLIKLISDWGFDEKYNELLEGIDKYILSEDKLVNSGMIGNLRDFMSDFIVDIATKASRHNKEEIPHEEKRSKVGDSRIYLRDKLNLSDEEHGFINYFVKILHDEGGHSFLSNKEYFRLTRNIAIEICLFLMSKATQKYPKIRG